VSWLDRLQTASFRGYKFLWEQVETSGGRRVVVHEYPFQDDPYAEDLGLKANDIRLNAYLIGKDHDLQATAFQKLLDQKGAGDLVTPLQGTMQAQLKDWSRTDTTAQGGISRFSLTFVRTGKVRFPLAFVNPLALLLGRLSSLIGLITGKIEQALSLWRAVRSAANFEIGGQLQAIAALFGSNVNVNVNIPAADASAATISAWVREQVTAGLPPLPATWATDLPDVQGNPQTQLASALTLQDELIQQINNTVEPPHILTLALQQHTLETAIRVSLQAFESYSQATAVQDAINDLITRTVELPVLRETLSADDLNAWSALRVDIAANLARQLLVLPKVQHVNISYPLPAVVIAHRLYRDADRAGEITTRNRQPHPGFCSGALEYLQPSV
jgi:prophage DNA circulation protein